MFARFKLRLESSVEAGDLHLWVTTPFHTFPRYTRDVPRCSDFASAPGRSETICFPLLSLAKSAEISWNQLSRHVQTCPDFNHLRSFDPSIHFQHELTESSEGFFRCTSGFHHHQGIQQAGHGLHLAICLTYFYWNLMGRSSEEGWTWLNMVEHLCEPDLMEVSGFPCPKKFKNSLGQWSMLVDLLDPQRSFKTIQEHPTWKA